MDYDHLPMPDLTETTVEGPIQTWVSQAQLRHKACPQPLHGVILATTNLPTHTRADVVLFRSDVDLADTPLVDYDGLRFPRELHFRDAKQSGGLEDCMNVTPPGVSKAAQRSLFMVHVADCLRTASHPRDSDYSVLDWKADWRASTYVEETRKMLPEKPEPV